jgi:hypothetical protein
MHRVFTLLVVLLALLVAAAPVSAHHGKGSHAGAPSSDDGASEDHGGFAACDWQTDPDSCPGNSGWAHWCKLHHGPGQARGQCIAEHTGSDDGKSEERGGFAACDWQTDPDSCPGNSGWAHWCKLHHGPGQARGRCIAEHAGRE